MGAPGQTVLGQDRRGAGLPAGRRRDGLGSVRKVYDETMVGAGGPEPGDGFGSAIAANSWRTVAMVSPVAT